MSLDVYLSLKGEEHPQTEISGAIFVRENGSTVQISEEEWRRRYPGREPYRVTAPENDGSGDCEVFSANITHNLNRMADEAEIYKEVWRPEENGITTAAQLIEPLRRGIAAMKADPIRFKLFDAPNGWGVYEDFVPWLERYLAACEEYPTALVRASR